MMRSASFQSIDHVSVSPTDGIGSTQGQRKTLTRVGIMNPRPSGLITAAPPTELQGQTVITVASRKFFRFPKISFSSLSLFSKIPQLSEIFHFIHNIINFRQLANSFFSISLSYVRPGARSDLRSK